MRMEEGDRLRPCIRCGAGVVDRTGIVVEAMGRSLVEVHPHRLPALNHARHDFRNPAILVVVRLRENGEQFRIHAFPRRQRVGRSSIVMNRGRQFRNAERQTEHAIAPETEPYGADSIRTNEIRNFKKLDSRLEIRQP